jgi:hypothetical protein
MHPFHASEVAMCKGNPRKFAAVLRRRSIAAGRLLAGAALALGLSPLAAQNQRERAVDAAFADGLTTAVGVAAAGGAINPVGPLLATAMKAFTLQRASQLPEVEQPAAYALASAMWEGGTVTNVCIAAVFLSGGGFAPVCLAAGAAWGLKSWDDSEHERRFWERCAAVRLFAVRENVECVYAPGKLALARETPPAQAHGKPRPGTRATTLILTPTASSVPSAAVAERWHEVEAP